MTGIFEVLAADDSQERLAGRQATVLANMRVNERLGKFLREADSQEEWGARLDLVHDDIDAIVADACAEVGYAAQGITRAVIESSLSRYAARCFPDQSRSS
jgi:hypothetical protein